MADPRFFTNCGPLTLDHLAEIAGAEQGGSAPGTRLFRDIGPLQGAGPDDVSWLDNPAYLEDFARSRAGCCVVRAQHADRAPAGMALLISDQPYRAFALVAQRFYPPTAPVPGVAPGAVVDPTAQIGDGTEIAANAVIGAGAEIGRSCRIGANVTIAEGVVIGDECRIGANASLSHCRIGNRVTLHPGVRVGQDGFGFAPSASGHVKVPQVGTVIIHDDCEIGANTTIDRGSVQDTVIGPGCWLDNLVQIGHNVRLGRGCIVVAQAGISGSTELGDFVSIGGQAGVAGHLKIGAGAQIAAQAGVMQELAAGGRYAGSPAVPAKEFFRLVAAQRRSLKREESDNG